MLTKEIKNAIEKSVLCWLATADTDGIPNVSPKEIFTYYGENEILVANIASPKTVKNIKQNENICVSFVDIFVQKGFKIIGKATILNQEDNHYEEKMNILKSLATELFPVANAICIEIEKVEPIISPRYRLYPDTTEAQQIQSAYETYGVKGNDL